MKPDLSPKILFAGIQWMFFILTNTVVVPLTLGQAFHLQPEQIAASVQMSFVLTGAACVLQAWIGHRYALMEGPSGVWWGLTLSLAATAGAGSGGPGLAAVGGGLAAGYLLSALLMVALGALGFVSVLTKVFNPIVISVFLFLLTVQLEMNFFSGMLAVDGEGRLNPSIAALSAATALFVGLLYLKGRGWISNFALLLGMIVGWIVFEWLFPGYSSRHAPPPSHPSAEAAFAWFPWGAPRIEIGIMITSFVVGLVNMSNTVTALSSAEKLYKRKTTNAQYRRSFVLTGAFSALSPAFGLLPFGTFASSLGLLESTKILNRSAMVIGSGLFFLFGLVPPLGDFLSEMPLSIGSAVLFVAYLQMFGTAVRTIRGQAFDSKTIYRLALPILLGICIMNVPAEAFSVLPVYIRPLLGSGLIVGIVVSVLLETTVNWQREERED
ncbi:uracil/xanthine transporter [Cohnella faecalis]|uniref:Uracil/xanthine transporter n=1 Tax=Cohnella faecalis TaxID=2315694 RepID=A0A398CPW2_9BACL|nr:uracil/xanthine transporter [Cohnella faecalis]RIE01867.1 uracil/xanthine transporter [Cohnella faecalis]RIE04918.1 uracil/xanthine transporter [Cohnella faecalis]